MMLQFLTPAERDRLVELIDILNTATQVDLEEEEEFNRLLYKLTTEEDGE